MRYVDLLTNALVKPQNTTRVRKTLSHSKNSAFTCPIMHSTYSHPSPTPKMVRERFYFSIPEIRPLVIVLLSQVKGALCLIEKPPGRVPCAAETQRVCIYQHKARAAIYGQLPSMSVAIFTVRRGRFARAFVTSVWPIHKVFIQDLVRKG